MIETKYRRIVTAIPNPQDAEIIGQIAGLESEQSNRELPVVWDRADDFQIYDRWGNCWIDMTSSIFVTNAGHNAKYNVGFIRETLDKGLTHAYCYPTVERASLLVALNNLTPDYLQKFSLVTTGTEASERALKLARLYNFKDIPQKNIIVGGSGNYHGKTMGALMSATTPESRAWIGYQDPNMLQMPFPYPWVLEERNISGEFLFHENLNALEETGTELKNICAMIIESYQGWGAVFYPYDYVQAMAKWCRVNDVLLIADEIQSGFGRTGKLFAYQHYDVEPDLVVCGKAISGGMPLSAVMGRADLIELDPSLTSTHGGHPLACAGALGNIKDFETRNLLAEAVDKGDYLYELLSELKAKFPNKISRLEGNGMVWGIFFKKGAKDESLDVEFVDRIVDRLLALGIFSIRTGRGTLKLGPPLTITKEALHEAIDVHAQVIEELINE